MNFFKKQISIFSLVLILLPAGTVHPQEMSEKTWEVLRDHYAVSIIKLMINLDTLNKEIDSIKQILKFKEEQIEKCEADLLELAGTTKSGVAEFRRRFEETEKKINSKTGSPADARKMYFDEITNDKARCLPEFSERYASLKKRLQDWEGFKPSIIEGTYLVVKGDCLWRISILKYNSPYYWPAIWEANKNGVVNKDELLDPRHKAVINPNLIYPGQILKIPSVNNTSKTERIEKFKKFRKARTLKKQN